MRIDEIKKALVIAASLNWVAVGLNMSALLFDACLRLAWWLPFLHVACLCMSAFCMYKCYGSYKGLKRVEELRLHLHLLSGQLHIV